MNFKGKTRDDMKGQNLIGVTYSNAQDKNGNVYIDFQLDSRGLDVNTNPQSNLHAYSEKMANDNYAHGVRYSKNQFDTMMKVAGDNVMETKLSNGNSRIVFGVNGDLKPIYAGANKGKGYFVTPKSDFKENPNKIDGNTLKNQAAYQKESAAIIAERKLEDIKAREAEESKENQMENQISEQMQEPSCDGPEM